MKISFLNAGYCTHPEFILLRGGKLKNRKFPASVAYIHHPKHGHIVFDTGYSERFYEATSSFPEKVYALVTPVYVQPEDTAAYQLRAQGVAPEDVNYVILSHFHADHAGGVADFPNAKYLFLDRAYEAVASLGRINRVKAGFLKDLLPEDFTKRSQTIDENRLIDSIEELQPFPKKYDIFGDGSLIAVPLPGHAPGHMGLFINSPEQRYFLVSDACWLREQFTHKKSLNPITYMIMESRADYLSSIDKIHDLYHSHTGIEIVPCHCSVSLEMAIDK